MNEYYYTCTHTHTHTHMGMQYICPIFFMDYSKDRQLFSLYNMTRVNIATMNIGINVYKLHAFLLQIHEWNRWIRSSIFYILKRTSMLLSIVIYSITFSPVVNKYSPASSLAFVVVFMFHFVFLMIAILTGVRWNLNVILNYISPMARDVEYFLYLFVLILINSSSFHLQISWLNYMFYF